MCVYYFDKKVLWAESSYNLWAIIKLWNTTDIGYTAAMTNTENMSGLILGLRPTNERQCYLVTLSLIGWAQA